MTTRGFTAVASRLRKESADDTDRDLLTRFLREQDEAAFEALVSFDRNPPGDRKPAGADRKPLGC